MSATEVYRYFQDKEGTEVCLFQHTWEEHILRRHPEMIGGEIAIGNALSNPEAITSSIAHRDRKIYYLRDRLKGFDDVVFVKIVVQYTITIWGSWQGTIVTAYATDSIPEKEHLLWPI